MKKHLLAVAIISQALCVGSAMADGHAGKIQSYYDANITSWLGASEIASAVNMQNEKNSALTEADIAVLDTQWRAEKKTGGGDLMAGKLGNDLSGFLKGIRDKSDGVIVEIFVMDNKGLNVGQTDPTGDYMQGDEAKWQKTYQMGPGSLFIDEVEEDGGKNISQASATVVDSKGAAIGAVTIAIDVDTLK